MIDKFLNNALTEESTEFDGINPLISRLNHSCTANCIHWIQPQSDSNDRFSARIIALYDIPKHSELTINYLRWNPLTFKERARRLKLDGILDIVIVDCVRSKSGNREINGLRQYRSMIHR